MYLAKPTVSSSFLYITVSAFFVTRQGGVCREWWQSQKNRIWSSICSSCSVAVGDKHPCICPSWLVKSVQWSTCYSHWLLYEPRAVLTCRVCFVLPALLLSAWDFECDCRRRRHWRTLTLEREALTQVLLVSLLLSCFVLPCFVLSCLVLQCHRQSWPCRTCQVLGVEW